MTGERELPPVPEPGICRWCDGRMVRLSNAALYCPSGCEVDPIYVGHCEDCERDFKTGKRFASHQCWWCFRNEMAAQRAMYEQDGTTKPTGYGADMRSKGANREAIKLKGDGK